jgi:hypothetical protein
MASRIMIGFWIALLCSSITPAGADPFDIMVGCWKGKGDYYTPDGVYRGSVSSRGVTYWKNRPTLLYFREDEEGRSNEILQSSALKAAVDALSRLEYDLQVNGKSLQGGCSNCNGTSANIQVIGTETHTDVYHFHLNFQNFGSGQDGNWYNNHYFTGRNERHVLGSFEPAGNLGNITFVAVQTLTRLRIDPKQCMGKQSQ